jgi:hypothetical protein
MKFEIVHLDTLRLGSAISGCSEFPEFEWRMYRLAHIVWDALHLADIFFQVFLVCILFRLQQARLRRDVHHCNLDV